MRGKLQRENRKKAPSKRINSADVMILILCIICIGGMVLRLGVMDKIEHDATAKAATVSVLIEGISSTSRNCLVEGDDVYFSKSGARLGTVSSILSVTPSIVYEPSDDGTLTQHQSVDGKIDVRAVLSVEGSMTESGFLLDGTTYIAPNMAIPIKTAGLSVTVLVTDIAVVNN